MHVKIQIVRYRYGAVSSVRPLSVKFFVTGINALKYNIDTQELTIEKKYRTEAADSPTIRQKLCCACRL